MRGCLKFAAVAACLLPWAGFACAAPLTPADQTSISEMMTFSRDLIVTENAEQAADITFDGVFKLFGGRAKFVEITKAAFPKMRETTILSHTYKLCDQTEAAGLMLVCPVVETTTGKVNGRTMRIDGYTLAVKSIAGGRWTGINGGPLSSNPTLLGQLLPGLPKSFQLPPYKIVPLD